MEKICFNFGSDITHETLYSQNLGYGFVDLDNLKGASNSEQALYCGGWNLNRLYSDSWKNSLSSDSSENAPGVEITSPKFAMIFKADVPNEGAYRISLTINASNKAVKDMTVYTGRRNVVARNINIEPGNSRTISFISYVAPYIPAMTSGIYDEKSIYISATGENARFSKLEIEKADVPTLFIAGDSTLTDQNAPFPYYPYASCAGWAQSLNQYFDNLAICNQAHSGMTTNCFRDDGHWDIVKSHVKHGDVVILQFGHNDQKRRNLSAFGGYINNLRWYVSQIRSIGASPIIVSPISRIPFTDRGEYRSLLSAHALACRMVCDELKVPFIDLHEMTFDFLKKMGEEKSHDYYIPGDITHTNDYGAQKYVSFVIDEIRNQKIEPLYTMLKDIEAFNFSPDNDSKKIPECDMGNFKINPPYTDIAGIPQYSYIVRAFDLGLLDPCVLHIHPEDIMPRAQFLMVYFKALRINGKRPYNGKYCDLSRYEWDSSYVEACIDENLIDESTVSRSRFRPDDALTYGEFASFVIRGMKPNVSDRDIPLGECMKKALELNLIPANAVSDKAISRADCYKGLVILMDLIDNKNKALPSDAEIHPVG